MSTQIPWLDPRSEKRVFVKSGEVYEFVQGLSTRAGHTHPPGSLLFVHDETNDAPFGEVGPRGTNWICRTQFGISIWSTLEHCIERGVIRRVSSVEPVPREGTSVWRRLMED